MNDLRNHDPVLSTVKARGRGGYLTAWSREDEYPDTPASP